jgi:SOS-response transcriptional repressor LexA
MNEIAEKSEAKQVVRPTKKQKELLTFIEDFIAEHGYSPSYREIMTGTGHTSVATVSLHVNNLIKRGHLLKRDRSARSLEVVNPSPKSTSEVNVEPKQLKTTEEKWLIAKIEVFFKEAESAGGLNEAEQDKLHILIGALKVLGLDGAAQSFSARLSELKKRQASHEYSV